VTCPLWAVHTASRFWHKLRVPFVEWRFFQNEQDIVLNPLLKMPDWK
jgi:hypothetical protein